MAPYTNIPLSPAELSYLHTSLSQDPPIRPDGRTAETFRPVVAETNILPSANGSARICFADGTEAIVGVKAEVEKSEKRGGLRSSRKGELKLGTGSTGDVEIGGGRGGRDDAEEEADGSRRKGEGEAGWMEISIEIPGMRDDDSLPVFLAAMLTEALLADGNVTDRLWINSRFHWRLHIDILLLSQPLSYPLPLLSLTTHLALLSTRLPALISQGDEDPLFNDDWDASTPLYPRAPNGKPSFKPPITLLVMTVNVNILFDPSKEELAVADSVVAISTSQAEDNGKLKLVALRMVDPPSRLTASGVPNTSTGASLIKGETPEVRMEDAGQTIWRPPRGGVGRGLLSRMIKEVVERVGKEVMEGLDGVES